MTDKRAGLHSSRSIIDDLRPRGKRADKADAREAADVESERESANEPEVEGERESAGGPEAESASRPEGQRASEGEGAGELPVPEAPPSRSGAKRTSPATPRTKGIAAPDPRLPDVEKALARGDWGAIAKLLAPTGDTSALPPAMRLVWAVATKEADRAAGTAIDAVAIESVAELLGVRKESPVALVLAKRTLRRRGLASAPAPSATVSSIIVIGGLALGLGVGWLVTLLLY